MTRTNKKLDALEEVLERTGEDPQRLELVRCAQRFKRSWVELAKALAALRQSRAYEMWGYSDLMDYCQKELAIRPQTADKLLLSLSTLERHAPEVLRRDGVARNIPSIEAVDFYNRALGNEERPGPLLRLDAPDELVEQLKAAVFDEGQSVRELRERFAPAMRPKSEADPEHDMARKARAAATRLHELVPEVPGLTEARVGRVLAILEALISDIDAMLDKPAAARRSSPKRAPNPS